LKRLVIEIRKDLKAGSDEGYRRAIQVFFKEGIKLYGVRTPAVRKISQKYYAAIKDRPRDDAATCWDPASARSGPLPSTGLTDQERDTSPAISPGSKNG